MLVPKYTSQVLSSQSNVKPSLHEKPKASLGIISAINTESNDSVYVEGWEAAEPTEKSHPARQPLQLLATFIAFGVPDLTLSPTLSSNVKQQAAGA